MHSPQSNSRFEISALDRGMAVDLQRKIDQKTKPLGALGRLESLALQLGLIQRSLAPRVVNPHVLVCAGDHGAAKAGVSAFPQEVTWQMVENFLAGGAAINVLAKQAGMRLVVADAGVAHEFGPREGLANMKVGAGGTANYLEGAAMSDAECATAMANGATLARDFAAAGCNVLGFGEMGIGNTASASLITHCITGLPLADCVGRGTGLDDAGLARKRVLLAQALSAWPERPPINRLPLAEGEVGRGSPHLGKAEAGQDALRVLTRFGGFEIAMLAGAMLAAAEARMTLLIDGFIVTSALLVAAQVSPAILDYCVYAHCSNEAGHRRQLDWLKGRPLLDLGLRLGEGTGAALALPLLNAACAFMNEMASFESAGVSEKTG
ncbi:nicotinate-nucleotide--dimethylbenzimidazole phosphoribosyltransferase [Sulfuritalea hydrogenivorans sk43H]|jgi:nicotinate-nucleotide--dimethylbenzimidazole phosphoribosyltransferase|uniref:Nicotinate-nucleotide--dimethylbenzimidazole phosphoribosyltransferase n=2 Tax=Sulfuritalea hydrogenivorans TaxID=748811 RepID=W0SKM4_9PROT|nr:nicotinate-nucleotide--dimethylbenzimidazole phosphoribosyltransferase [Sulfuritalea hydrogenivorans sk43H]